VIIKLTNISKGFQGPLLINPSHIMSVFLQTQEVGDAIEINTVVYAVTKEAWTVKESVEEIYELIKGVT
jgi:hypothetical protein